MGLILLRNSILSRPQFADDCAQFKFRAGGGPGQSGRSTEHRYGDGPTTTLPGTVGGPLPVRRAPARAAGPARNRPGPLLDLHTFGKHLCYGCGRNRELAGSVRQTK